MNTLERPTALSAANRLKSVEITESLPSFQHGVKRLDGGTRSAFKKILLYFSLGAIIIIVGLVGLPYSPCLLALFFESNSFDYDLAREICNQVSGIMLVLSLLMCTHYLRTRKTVTKWVVFQAVALIVVVPGSVYVLGTYMINNYGGLISGL
ncbi:MAG: hypothetical protein JST89_07170 [Cyanobacteria bacterium SZAS-4]|nr:hypothetical protein [Cyanobacteria bacterium SZAS-4]